MPAEPRPELSLVLPTFRRPHMLRAALQSIARSTGCSRDGAEIVVVDNNSGDETPAAVEEMRAGFPFELRYVREPRQGVAHARNAGAAAAAGRYIVFMDDDQQIDPAYLARVPASFAETGADCIGGWTGYVGQEEFPPWLRAVVARMGQRDLGPELKRLGRGEAKLQGGNLAIRREVFERLGGFRADFDNGGACIEDIELQVRLIEQGGTIVYDPALRQFHFLEPARMSRRYYLGRAYNAGRCEARLNRPDWKDAARFGPVPRFLVRQAIEAGARVVGSVAAPAAVRFDRLCDMAATFGQLREASAGQGLRSN